MKSPEVEAKRTLSGNAGFVRLVLVLVLVLPQNKPWPCTSV